MEKIKTSIVVLSVLVLFGSLVFVEGATSSDQEVVNRMYSKPFVVLPEVEY